MGFVTPKEAVDDVKLKIDELIDDCKWRKEDAENLNICREIQSVKYKNFLDSIN